MSKKDSWLSCEACESEFKIFSDSDEDVLFCPYCGYELENKLDEEEWDIDDIMDNVE
jgi:rRNA maturation endonuclease Nob1